MTNMKKNLLSVYGVNFLNGLAGIAFIPLALKALGAEGYGIYSIFIILTSYVYFVEMGVAKYFTRSIARSSEEQNQKGEMQTAVGIYIRIAVILILLTPLLLYIVPNFIFPTNNNGIVSKMVFLSVIDYLLSIPVAILMTYNIGKENFLKISKYNLIAGLSRHLFLICGVLIFKSILIIIFIMLLRRIFDIYYSIKYLERLPDGAWKPKYEKGEFKKIISQSLLLSAAQLTQVTILAIGTYLVNKNFSLAEVGIYRSSFDIATKVWFFSNGLGLVIFPRFSAMLVDKSSKIKLLDKLISFNKISWVLYHVIFITAVFLLPIITNILLIQDQYLFLLLLYGVCINAHTNLSYEFLQADSKLKEVIIISLAALLIIIIGFHLLLAEFNLYAIGLTWILSQLIYSVAMDYFALKDSGNKKVITTLSLNLTIFAILFIAYNFIR